MFSVCILSFKEKYEISLGAGSFNMGTLVPNCSSKLSVSASKLLKQKKLTSAFMLVWWTHAHVPHMAHHAPKNGTWTLFKAEQNLAVSPNPQFGMCSLTNYLMWSSKHKTILILFAQWHILFLALRKWHVVRMRLRTIALCDQGHNKL
jgi:hypothetical protein